ncbi:patatin-like phospholipase family protein [Caldimonas tepidiphila]|uniref:patatin-like phospholipase family protein n=1 Tax=Caldimonas tepidiphila TaxID=2315841 RepID=UPI000E5BF033|nr:patatin-like phospholipase family protein [Caldimonas tepidiphila]
MPRRPLPIELALQGGGSHGAFTWGVLDRLLDEERLEIVALAGASAGAMNAAVFASGLLEGGREGARAALRRFWTRVSRAAAPHPFGAWSALFTPWGADAAHLYLDALSRIVSPYQLNPFDLNPLRDILAEEVDFERLRRDTRLRLFVSATHVRSGRLKVFRHEELSAAAVMASACLPLLFRAVEIDGEAYWDGGYAGNPPVMPLVAESPAHDLLLVQINPVHSAAVPTRAQDIVDRINEISFNASLLREMRTLALMKQLIESEGRPGQDYRSPLFAQVERLRTHRIHGESALLGLGPASKLRTSWDFLCQLFDIGRSAADAWLHWHGRDLGRRATLDLAEYLTD